MKKFLILMTNDDAAWEALTEADKNRVIEAHEALHAALTREGKLLSSHRVRPANEARVVTRDRNGAFSTTSGGYLPGNRAIGGFYLIEAESLAEAAQWAERGRFITGANIVHEVWE